MKSEKEKPSTLSELLELIEAEVDMVRMAMGWRRHLHAASAFKSVVKAIKVLDERIKKVECNE